MNENFVHIEAGQEPDTYAQVIQLVVMIAGWDGWLSNEETEFISKQIDIIAGIGQADFDAEIHSQCNDSFEKTIALFQEAPQRQYEGLVFQAMNRLTDPAFRRLTLRLAYLATNREKKQGDGSISKGINRAELSALDFFGKQWGMRKIEIKSAILGAVE